MEYITVKEAGEKWALGIRMVTLYCNEGRIDGAVKKGNMWLIPADSERPADRRRKAINKPCGISKEIHSIIPSQLLPDGMGMELFVEIINSFPYPMHICSSQGEILYTNKAFLEFAKASDSGGNLGKHNILKDPNLERWGIKDFVDKAYNGKVSHAYDVKVPMREVVEMFGGNDELISETLFQNITAFPINNENNQLAYIVTIFVTSRFYQDREEITKGKKYIDEHWRDEFDMDALSDAVHMSKYHYIRIFKQHTGMTPNSYYQHVKFNKLKEKLCDCNLSITRAFYECGVDYKGNLSKKFKRHLGMTPTQYRTAMTEK
ncbi:MAG: helix-turn-helix transcriptional regulator [Clostridiaceae bacterium]|nr:helix-turn-helix transcriptional regulator [Clostridiaceae bacterium]